jgi:hypothetical protein
MQVAIIKNSPNRLSAVLSGVCGSVNEAGVFEPHQAMRSIYLIDLIARGQANPQLMQAIAAINPAPATPANQPTARFAFTNLGANQTDAPAERQMTTADSLVMVEIDDQDQDAFVATMMTAKTGVWMGMYDQVGHVTREPLLLAAIGAEKNIVSSAAANMAQANQLTAKTVLLESSFTSNATIDSKYGPGTINDDNGDPELEPYLGKTVTITAEHALRTRMYADRMTATDNIRYIGEGAGGQNGEEVNRAWNVVRFIEPGNLANPDWNAVRFTDPENLTNQDAQTTQAQPKQTEFQLTFDAQSAFNLGLGGNQNGWTTEPNNVTASGFIRISAPIFGRDDAQRQRVAQAIAAASSDASYALTLNAASTAHFSVPPIFISRGTVLNQAATNAEANNATTTPVDAVQIAPAILAAPANRTNPANPIAPIALAATTAPAVQAPVVQTPVAAAPTANTAAEAPTSNARSNINLDPAAMTFLAGLAGLQRRTQEGDDSNDATAPAV